ncbi:MAG: hypothetical protein KatS3mg005_1535 [Bryobacteraceae bacterium]|nr:MAG: hypothetical protein KatS3mg005_1535 [Bryobacteraceae bacterium]
MEATRQTDACPGGAGAAGLSLKSWPAWLAAAAAVILFAIPVAKPLYLDNMDFPAVAKATAETGLPIYYRGEENPRHSGLYHPPLYIYSLAAWFRLWGPGEAQARLFGLACLFLHGWVVLYGLRLLYGEKARAAAPWFWALFLLNPFTLQCAAVLDIDTSIYGPLLTALLAAALRIGWRDGEPRRDEVKAAEWILVAVLMALSMWAKLTTVLSVAPAAVLLLVPRLGWRRALLNGGGALAAGAALFLASYFVYGRATGQDVGYTFRFTLASLTQRSGASSGWEWLAGHWRIFLDMSNWQVRWSGLLPWAGAAGAAAGLVWRWRKGDRRSRDAAIVLLWALVVSGFYLGLTYTFGRAPFKYVFVGWGVIVACVAFCAAAGWRRMAELRLASPWWSLLAAGSLFAVCFVISGKWLRDRIVLEAGISRGEALALWLPAAALLAGLAMGRRRLAAALTAGGVISYAGLMAGMALAMARAPYSTTYNYGQEGFEETVCFIQQHTQPGDAILSMKDVGFRAGRRYFENYGYIFGGAERAEAARRILTEGKARYAVFTEGNGPDFLGLNPQLQEVIQSLCVLERSYGHYRIYDCAGAPAGSAERAAR